MGRGGCSFLAEAVERHDLAGLGRLVALFLRLGLGRRRARRHHAFARLELQPKLDRRIGEGSYCLPGNAETLGSALEGERDGEMVFLDVQIPELMLEDD